MHFLSPNRFLILFVVLVLAVTSGCKEVSAPGGGGSRIDLSRTGLAGGEGYGGEDPIVGGVVRALRQIKGTASALIAGRSGAPNPDGFPINGILCQNGPDAPMFHPIHSTRLDNFEPAQRDFMAETLLDTPGLLEYVLAYAAGYRKVRVVNEEDLPNADQYETTPMAVAERRLNGKVYVNHDYFPSGHPGILSELVAVLIHEIFHTYQPPGASETYDDFSPVSDSGGEMFAETRDMLTGFGYCFTVYGSPVYGIDGGLPPGLAGGPPTF